MVLRIATDRGLVGLFRFRVYYLPGYLERILATLKGENRLLRDRLESFRGQGVRRAVRMLSVTADGPPAAADTR